MAQRYLYLVRHGQYQMDREHANFGSLTPLGRRQALRIGKRLAEHYPIQRMLHSDMPRAIETADIIAEHLPSIPRRRTGLLREGIPTAPGHWKQRPERAMMDATRARMDSAYERFFKPIKGKRDKHEVIVAHGNLIRYLVRRAMGDPIRRWWRMDILQCSLCIIAVAPPPHRGVLVAFNDAGHLPKRMQTRL